MEYHDAFGAPALPIRHGKVVGVSGQFLRTNTSTVPAFEGGSALGGLYEDFNEAPGQPIQRYRDGGGYISFVFSIYTYEAYGNTAQTPGFYGKWAFDPSAVPEPATWAMMALGFGAIGAVMRGRLRVSIRHA